jgi:hypothetical protein
MAGADSIKTKTGTRFCFRGKKVPLCIMIILIIMIIIVIVVIHRMIVIIINDNK